MSFEISGQQFWGTLPPSCKVRVLSEHAGVTKEDSQWNSEETRLGQTMDCLKFAGARKPLASIYGAAALFSTTRSLAFIASLQRPKDSESPFAHGAPYQNLRIALDLLDQSDIYRAIGNTKSDILAATLAQDAYSLLLGMSNSVCYRALRSVHLSEARAEGESTGVSHAVSIVDRRRELECTMLTLRPQDGGTDFLAKVWAELRLTYKESEQFHASEAANSESLIHTAWIGKTAAIWARDVERHALACLTSIPRLIALFLLWPLILAILYAAAFGWIFCRMQRG